MNPRTIALPVLVLGIAAAIWWTNRAPVPDGTPAATWRVGPVGDFRQARNFDELPAESPLRLSYSCTRPRYVYVFSHSNEDGTLLLFPNERIKGAPGNPLPAGDVVLPGEHQEQRTAWTTRSEIITTTSYLVVAAAEPIAELEQLIPHLRHWSNSVLPNGSMLVTNPAQGVEIRGTPKQPWPSALLQRAADRAITESMVNGPLHPDEQLAGVWTSGLFVREQKGTAKPIVPGVKVK